MNFFNKLSLGSKILLTLLLTALLSILLIGYLGYSGGRDGLRNAVFNQLEGIRNVQAQALVEDFRRAENFVLTLSEDPMIINAIKEFKTAFAKLEKVEITPYEREKLVDFYEKGFIPELKKNTQENPVAQNYVPFKPAEEYLQYQYIAANPNPLGEKYKLDSAPDQSEYSIVHERYHQRFRHIVKRFAFYDIFLIDTTGQVLYSEKKEVDFVTNLKEGPYANSNLAKAFQQSADSRDLYYVSLVDFQQYTPHYARAGAFITTPVFEGNEPLGVLILELNKDKLNQVMTFQGKNWQKAGLGKTGETFLVGEDSLLRTDTRLFIEDKPAYFKLLESKNVDAKTINQIRNKGSGVLLQKISTDAVQKALAGESGAIFYKDFRGIPVVGAYQPVKIDNFRWALVAKMDEAEAFEPVSELTKRLIITSAILIPLFTLLSFWVSRLLAGPINHLIAGTKRVAAGEKDVQVKVESQDEIGNLTETFNSMAGSIDEKDRLIQKEIEENNRLLLNILPEPVAKRMRSGEENIADSFANVTIIYVEIEGFAELSDNSTANQSMKLLNELIVAFDETAEQFGVEKLKTIGSSYIAVCGLSIAREDHTKRAVDFSLALLKLINILNQKQGSNLGLDIGVHSGPVVAGIIGKSKFIYELWGETMNIATLIHTSDDTNIIQVSESVYKSLQGMYDFKPVNDFTLKGKGNIPVWSLHPLYYLANNSVGVQS